MRAATEMLWTRSTIDGLEGPALLEFGSAWCGWCRQAEPKISAALERHPVQHIKIEDGAGKPLGRSFGIKLWPTLVFLQDGVEVTRLVRPTALQVIDDTLADLVNTR